MPQRQTFLIPQKRYFFHRKESPPVHINVCACCIQSHDDRHRVDYSWATNPATVFPAHGPPTRPPFSPLMGHQPGQRFPRSWATNPATVFPAHGPPTRPPFSPLMGHQPGQRFPRSWATNPASVFPSMFYFRLI